MGLPFEWLHTEQMCPCVERDKLYFVCDQCGRIFDTTPYIVRIWRRTWVICSHVCLIEYYRGF